MRKSLPKKSNPVDSANSKKLKTGSLRKQMREIKGKTNLAKRESGKLAKKTGAVRRAAGKIRRGVERLHGKTEKTHAAIRNIGKPGSQITPGRDDSKSFFVVGIGASAGGYEATSLVLASLAPDAGVAIVVVQHLDPMHESRLTSLLSHSTKMEVIEIRSQMRVLPNHIYVMPPNTMVTLRGGFLRLTPRKKGLNSPIDLFFESLARDQGNLAVGVVLSGNGNDGAAGLKEIKANGGITFAQKISTCKFSGMPESALATGCVDFVMPPAHIARELQRLAADGEMKRDLDVLPGAESDFAKMFALLRSAMGVDFSSYKSTTLKRRISRRMALKKIDNLASYLKFLQQNSGEVELLFQDILINVTGFFRDPAAFHALKKKIFPRLLKQKRDDGPIRVWVPGCATGEEVYSLAISLHEFLEKKQKKKAVQLFGTDISENMVAKSRAGIYPRTIESQISPERLRRYFQKIDGGYQISKFIRDACIFAKQNVAEDPPFSKLDLISCRNLLIYLGLSLQKKVLPTFHYSLRPGGCLMLGSSETIGSFANLFKLMDKKSNVYIRSETYSRPEIEFMPTPQVEGSEVKPPKTKLEFSHSDLQRKAEEILLGQYCPPGVIVNGIMEAQHFLGKTGPYLDPASGSASLNLLKMVRDELTVDLRTAVAQANKTNLPVRKEAVRIQSNGHYREVALEVTPFKSSQPERLFLVLFREISSGPVEEPKGGQKKSPGARRQQQAEREAQRLHRELSQTKESLQTIIEAQEATNEELKSANEEIQSSNEELQSTNEELETAKEELQSTNEELTTLNEELQNRNGDLSQANNDLNNLFSSFNMPILMLGSDLTIRRFTPLAQKIFNLIPGDMGRRITDINPNIMLPDLPGLVGEVIESLNVKEIEVQDREGHWYSLRIRPYRTTENKIDGAVIVLVDIGEIRKGLEEVLEMVSQPMLLLSSDLHVSKANDAFYRKFKASKSAVEGHAIFRMGRGEWDVPALHTLLNSIVSGNQVINDFKLEQEVPGVGKRLFFVNARRLYQLNKGTLYVLILLRDAP